MRCISLQAIMLDCERRQRLFSAACWETKIHRSQTDSEEDEARMHRSARSRRAGARARAGGARACVHRMRTSLA